MPCGSPGRDLIKYFRFINRSWNDIGDKAVLNLNSLTQLSNNMDTNMYFLMAKILRDNNFLFQILPNYVNFRRPEDVQAMFKPQFTLEENEKSSSGPSYICIYCGGNSESVNIVQENRTYAYPNDSFNIFTNAGSEFTNLKNGDRVVNLSSNGDINTNPTEDAVGMVAFRVAFGSENQSMFKDVSLDQTEFRETGEYFSTLSELIDKRGGTQRVFKGTDLLKIFKTRSYKCGVESLGCMSIQPLMYFQLDNVPFFNGTYLITDVNHTINGNHMTTNFSGLRQSAFVTPVVDKYTTFLQLDFEEITKEPPTLDNLTDTDPDILLIGVIEELSKLQFNPKLITAETLLALDVDEEVVNELFSIPSPSLATAAGLELNKTYFELILKSFGIKRNDQVVFFLSQVLFNSKNMKYKSNSYLGNKGTAIVDGGVTQIWSSSIIPNEIKYMPIRNKERDARYGPSPGQGYIKDISDEDQWVELFRYRERGYINLISKSNYTSAMSNLNVIKYLAILYPPPNTPNLVSQPNTISDSIILSFVIAAYVFTTKTLAESKLPKEYKDKKSSVKNKTCNLISGEGTTSGGSYPRYQLVSEILQDLENINVPRRIYSI